MTTITARPQREHTPARRNARRAALTVVVCLLATTSAFAAPQKRSPATPVAPAPAVAAAAPPPATTSAPLRAPTQRDTLPNLDGLSPEQIRRFIGPPSFTQVRGSREIWTYATPGGPKTIQVGGASRSRTPPGRGSATARSTPPSSQPVTVAPDNGCDGLEARPGMPRVTILQPQSPAFVSPQILQDAVATFAPATVLPVVETIGAWYLVRFNGPQGPQAGYVHCTDVTFQDVVR